MAEEVEEEINLEADPVDLDDVVQAVLGSTAIYDQLYQDFATTFEFYGKTLDEWTDSMYIRIDNDLDPLKLRKLFIDLANKLQIAHNYYSIACSLNRVLDDTSDQKKSDQVAQIVVKFARANHKRPAAQIVERMADSSMKDLLIPKITSLLVKDFWKQRLDSLNTTKDILEQISIGLSVEVKHLVGGV